MDDDVGPKFEVDFVGQDHSYQVKKRLNGNYDGSSPRSLGCIKTQKGLKNMMVEFDMGCFKVYAFFKHGFVQTGKSSQIIGHPKI